jgi:hypothetical protein
VGWVVFDPSPQADALTGGQLSNVLRFASRAVLKTKMFWFREVVGFDRAAQVQRIQDFSLGIIRGFRGDAEGPAGVAADGVLGRLGYITPAVILVLLLGSVALVIRRVRWLPVPRGRSLSKEQVSAVRLYLLLRRRLQKFGVACAGKTAEELRTELHQPEWGAPEDALAVIEMYNTVRFGGHPATATEFVRLRKAVRNLRPRAT